jgi:hypothetical protein
MQQSTKPMNCQYLYGSRLKGDTPKGERLDVLKALFRERTHSVFLSDNPREKPQENEALGTYCSNRPFRTSIVLPFAFFSLLPSFCKLSVQQKFSQNGETELRQKHRRHIQKLFILFLLLLSFFGVLSNFF